MFGNISKKQGSKEMSVVVKRVKGREYAYIAYRQGKKVVNKYIGPMQDPEVRKRVEEIRLEKNVPSKFYSLFWDTDPSKIAIKANARYVIERVLEMGGMEAFQWVQRVYPTKLIIETCETSRKISEKSRNFWRIWLGLYHAH